MFMKSQLQKALIESRRSCSNIVRSKNSDLHISVLSKEAINYLQPKPRQVFIDMTFGAGGHTKQLLSICPDITVFALDHDPVAYQLAKKMRNEVEPSRLVPLFGKFSDLPRLLQKHKITPQSVDGMLFDFGCSSMQLDEAHRGFSHSKKGPLDMRMDTSISGDQITAEDVLARSEEVDIAKILRVYGEEKAAKKIARTIVAARSYIHKLETTEQLASLVASCMSSEITQSSSKLFRCAHAATKTFQALRIFVNNELNEINYGMLLANELIRLEGRLVAITFHSLEDTIVKRHLNGNVMEGMANSVPLKYCSHNHSHDHSIVKSLMSSNWEQLHKHVITPSQEEIENNMRSRSAKMRAAKKIK